MISGGPYHHEIDGNRGDIPPIESCSSLEVSFSESTRDRPRLEGEPETCESHGELLFAWLSRGGSNGLGGEREGVLWRGEALGMVLTREVNPALLPIVLTQRARDIHRPHELA